MRVLVGLTAFKGSLGAAEACAAVARGIAAERPGWALERLPLSDGGPGLLDALAASGGATPDGGPPREADREIGGGAGPIGAGFSRLEHVEVSGPLGSPARGRILWLGREAVLESADACGLEALGEVRAPLRADTRGVGELVLQALENGAEAVRIGLGGSASTDGGTGLARVFGWRFLDGAGRELPPGGGALRDLARIEPGWRPGAAVAGGRGAGEEPGADRPLRITALADVETRLTGMRGAARTFGPQKGATAAEVELLAAGLERLAEIVASDLGPWGADAARLPGSGAAGGLGAGCVAFLGGRLVPGAAWVLERTGFGERLSGADLVVTGEGAWDRSSGAGKITAEVLRRARQTGVPSVLLCGRLEAAVPAGVTAFDAGGGWLDAEGLEVLAARAVRSLQEPGAGR